MKIALGTTSEHKINFFKKVCQELNFPCEIISIEAASGVSDQPLTTGETKLGSINRAKAAWEKADNADSGLGIEVGYEKINGTYNILCWATFFSNNEALSCCSNPFPLPDFHHGILEQGLFLGDHVRTFVTRSDNSDQLKLAYDIVYREPYITDAIRQVINKKYLKTCQKTKMD
ncbi:MAG: DUF84 family protein [Patescibacteria group bacterium]